MSLQAGELEAKIMDAAQALLDREGSVFTMEQLEAATRISRATIYRRVGGKRALLHRLAEGRGESFEEPNIRLDILRAARVVFGREGLAAATIEQVAAEGGVGVATVYRHFGDKETLVLEYIERMTPRAAVNDGSLRPTDDVRADLETFLGAVMALFFDNRDIFRLALMGNRSDLQYLQGLRERSGSTLSRITDYFRVQIAAGRLEGSGGPEAMALALMGMVLSFSVFGPMNYGIALDDPERTSRLIVDLFLSSPLTERGRAGGA
jgi:AcrR family transcriptional regulator